VGVEVKADTPIVRQILNPDATAVRVTVAVAQLTEQNTSNGDIHGSSVQLQILVQASGGSFVPVDLGGAETITGKTRSRYQRSFRIPLTGSAPWNIRVARITEDSTNSAIQNRTFWDTYTEITDVKLTYPNSVLGGLKVDAQQFSSVPTRGYHVKMTRVRIPSNYNPVLRTYTGVWDGTFTIAYTNNPAWCFYDLVTSKRYGLGKFIPEELLDKWTLFTIGKYCDEMVADGKGGFEPRFTLNVYLQTREQAYKVVSDLASVFRGMVYWATGAIYAVQDAPADPVAIFTSANVVDGTFAREGSARKARHTVSIVQWLDPNNFFKQTPEYVEDADGIARYGIREKRVVAFGCTSQGQANRVGKWILFTESSESDVISFRTGLDATYVRPGQIAKIIDPARVAARYSGRVHAATSNSITLDAPVDLDAGVAYELSVMMPDGTLVERPVTNSAATGVSTITFATPLADTAITEHIWCLSSPNLEPELIRVLAIVEDTPSTYKITGLFHNASKFGAIESNLKLETPNTSDIFTQANNVQPPTDLKVNAVIVTDAVGERRHLDLSWTAPADTKFVSKYFVEYRINNGNWVGAEEKNTSFRILDVIDGEFAIRVRSVSITGRRSSTSLMGFYTVVGTLITGFGTVTGLELVGQGNDTVFKGRDAKFVWRGNSARGSSDLGSEPFGGNSGFIDPTFKDYRVNIYNTGGELLNTYYRADTSFTYTFEMNHEDGAGRAFIVGVAMRDRYNRVSPEARLQVSNPNVAPIAITSIRSSFKTIFVEVVLPTETDWENILAWVGTDSAFTPGSTNLRYRGRAALFSIDADPGIQYYVKVAGADSFGEDNMNISGALGVLTAQINAVDIAQEAVQQSHLFHTLSTRIDLIDAAAGVPGSVNARLASEQTLRQNADDALASQITQFSASGAVGFDTAGIWNFDTTADGWVSGANSTPAWVAGGLLNVTGTGAAPSIKLSADLSPGISGALYTSVRARIKRLAGTGWTGDLQFKTAGHGFSSSFFKRITTDPVPAVGASATIDFDMSALTAGGSDWTSSTILNLQLILGAGAGDNFQIDWIAVGRSAPGASTASLQQESIVRASTDTGLLAQWTVKTDLDGYVAGFGLASTLQNDTPFSEFIVRVDRFAIGSASGTDIVPFIVSGGVTYIDTTNIKNASIVNAQILSLNADKIVATNLAAITASLGAVSAAQITIDTVGWLKSSGMTSYAAATGFFLGYESGAYKLFVGNPVAKYLAWDGSDLILNGQVVNTANMFANAVTKGASATSASSVSCVFDGASQFRIELGPVSVTTQGNPVDIIAEITWHAVYPSRVPFVLAVVQDGSEVGFVTLHAVWDGSGVESGSQVAGGNDLIIVRTTPGAGTHSYTLRLRSSCTSFTANRRAIVITERRR
jgi:hypothetical protein